jgi:CubicO group peptidase (beta-lactamase class C family)
VKEPQGITASLSPGSCGHGGAYGTQAWIDPTKGLIYVLMIQRSNIGNSDGSELRKVFHDTVVKALGK